MPEKSWLIEWGAFVLALAALAQPWLFAIYRWLRKGRVEIHETGFLEINHSAIGPSVGIRGSLRAMDKDQFVRSIEIKVKNLSDKSERKLNWLLSRKNVLRGDPNSGRIQEEIISDLVYPFGVGTNEPREINILFCDFIIKDKLQNKLAAVQKTWNDSLRGILASGRPPDQVVKDSEDIFSAMLSSPEASDAYKTVEREFYWNEGTYQLDLTIFTSRPSAKYDKQWTFKLSSEASERLRNNNVLALREICKLQHMYASIWARYECS